MDIQMNVMGIDWKEDERDLRDMAALFLKLGKRAISMNHYDLYQVCGNQYPMFTPDKWREFITDPRVSTYINSEFDAIKSAELRKIITDINSSKSVGQAQIINSLAKMLEGEDKRNTGPIFIYSYVPLTDEQAQASNVQTLSTDPFIVE